MQLNAYLVFNGQCEAAFKFYEKVLGGNVVGGRHDHDREVEALALVSSTNCHPFSTGICMSSRTTLGSTSLTAFNASAPLPRAHYVVAFHGKHVDDQPQQIWIVVDDQYRVPFQSSQYLH